MKRLTTTLVLLLVVLGGIVLVQRRAIQRLEGQYERLLDEKANVSSSETTTGHSASEERGQQTERSELLRLRAEVNALRRAIKDATNNAGARSAAAATAAATPPPRVESPVKVFETTAEVLLQPGETFMTGGWETSPGRRTVMLASPTVIDAAGNADPSGNQIVVRTHFIEMPDAVLQSLNAHQPGDGVIRATFNENRTRELLGELENTTGVDILTAPATTTLTGQRAQISVQEVRTFPDPTASAPPAQHWVGPSVDLVPAIAHNGAVTLSIAPKISMPNPNWGR